MAIDAGTGSALGDVLRYWRRKRGHSQLDLAAAAGTTPRYMSFVETGRAQPSRQMVLRLARALDVPLRERNGILLAAGYAPVYSCGPLDSRPLEAVAAALSAMLDHHEPFPAVVMDRGWTVLRANKGSRALFGRLLAPDPVPQPANLLRLMLAPGPVRDAVANWEAVASALLDRVHREAVGGALNPATADLLTSLTSERRVADAVGTSRSDVPAGPVIDVHFRLEEGDVHFFSVVSTIGTPMDVTAQELRIEAFFPSDHATDDTWRAIVEGSVNA